MFSAALRVRAVGVEWFVLIIIIIIIIYLVGAGQEAFTRNKYRSTEHLAHAQSIYLLLLQRRPPEGLIGLAVARGASGRALG